MGIRQFRPAEFSNVNILHPFRREKAEFLFVDIFTIHLALLLASNAQTGIKTALKTGPQ